MTGGCSRIAVAAGKGGVGKTTTTMNLGAALAEAGWRCLLVDCDPQANLTQVSGLNPDHPRLTLVDVLRADVALGDAIMSTGRSNLDLLPASRDLAGVKVTLEARAGHELRLRQALDSDRTAERYDFIIFDTAASLGFHTTSALAAAEHVLVPLQISAFALRGLHELESSIAAVRHNFNAELRLLGAVPTFVERRATYSRDLLQALADLDGIRIFENGISRSVRVLETSTRCSTVLQSAPTSRPAAEFRALAAELVSALEMVHLAPVPALAVEPLVAQSWPRRDADTSISDATEVGVMAPQMTVTVASADVELRVLEVTGVATPPADTESDQADLMAAWLGRSAPLEAVPVPSFDAELGGRRRRFPRLFRGR